MGVFERLLGPAQRSLGSEARYPARALTAFGISFGRCSRRLRRSRRRQAFIAIVLVAYPLMIAARSIYGIFGSGAAPAAQGLCRRPHDTRGAHLEAWRPWAPPSGLGTTIGPGIGAVFVVFGLLAPFYFGALVAFASAAAIWLSSCPSARRRMSTPIAEASSIIASLARQSASGRSSSSASASRRRARCRSRPSAISSSTCCTISS